MRAVRRTVIDVTAAAAVTVTAGVILAGCGSTAQPPAAQPPTAQAVAQIVHAVRFTDCGAAPLGGVTDSGTAYLNGERIGVDTFPGADIRDTWERTSRSFGVVPFAQGDTWVAYKATDQKARGCD